MSNEVNQFSQASFLNSQIACALIRMEGMKAENMQRDVRGESMAYVEEDFFNLIQNGGIGHNDAATTLWHT